MRKNYPWEEIKKLGAEKIICVAFENEIEKEKKNINILDVITGAFELISYDIEKYETFGVDYLLKIESAKINLLDKSKIDLFYELGYENTKKNIDEIKKTAK